MLSSFRGRVMWSSSVMVFIFAAAGITGGSAFLILLTHLKNLLSKTSSKALHEQRRYLSEFGVILKYSLLAQAGVWFVYLVLMQYTGLGGRLVSHLLMDGPRAFQFWFFQVAVGLALPFVLTLYRGMRERPLVASLAAVAALVGTLCGVINIFMGGQSLPMTHFRWEQLEPEPGKMTFGIGLMVLMFLVFLVTYKILPYENADSQEGGA
jgi:molybdopterin-containing oxidoreductase family membrane subunit